MGIYCKEEKKKQNKNTVFMSISRRIENFNTAAKYTWRRDSLPLTDWYFVFDTLLNWSQPTLELHKLYVSYRWSRFLALDIFKSYNQFLSVPIELPLFCFLDSSVMIEIESLHPQLEVQ